MRLNALALMGTASFLVLNLALDTETSSGQERYSVQQEIASKNSF